MNYEPPIHDPRHDEDFYREQKFDSTVLLYVGDLVWCDRWKRLRQVIEINKYSDGLECVSAQCSVMRNDLKWNIRHFTNEEIKKLTPAFR